MVVGSQQVIQNVTKTRKRQQRLRGVDADQKATLDPDQYRLATRTNVNADVYQTTVTATFVLRNSKSIRDINDIL